MIASPILSIFAWYFPAFNSSSCFCRIDVSTSASLLFVSSSRTDSMFLFNSGKMESFLYKASFTAVTTALCRLLSRIVLAEQSTSLLFFRALLTHRQTIDLQPLLFHLIRRKISPQRSHNTMLDNAYLELYIRFLPSVRMFARLAISACTRRNTSLSIIASWLSST